MVDVSERMLAGLAGRTMTRRAILRAGALAGATLGLGSLLAACGGDDDDSEATKPAATATSGTTGGTAGSPTAAGGGASPTSATTGTSTVDFSQAKSGGKVTMSLADQDIGNFDPIIPGDNMSI